MAFLICSTFWWGLILLGAVALYFLVSRGVRLWRFARLLKKW